MTEEYNLDREIAVEKNVDPTGRKWEIVHLKGSALYEARPNPYRADTQIPDEFAGKWTKHTLLNDQINLYLNRVWDASELATKKNARKAHASKQSKQKKATKDEINDLSAIPDKIKRSLGALVE
tara:strand:+ start:11704 stop:12075 length:372 start_codon:yes stop_codon:yes gene_type:complete